MKTFFSSLNSLYRWLAFTFLNTLIIFIALNLLLGIGYQIKSRYFLPKAEIYSSGLFNEDGTSADTGERAEYLAAARFDARAFEGADQKEIIEIVDDFINPDRRGRIYHPWVQFSLRTYESKHLNIADDERKFKMRVSPPVYSKDEKPVVRIFVMGGSTTFGWLVSDNQTWPFYLSEILNEEAEKQGLPFHIEVRNYASSRYEDSQETVLLMDQLKNGLRPSLVIFMDGINTYRAEDAPYFTNAAGEGFLRMQFKSTKKFWQDFFNATEDWVPLIKMSAQLNRKLFKISLAPPPRIDTSTAAERLGFFTQRLIQNRKIAQNLCLQYGCETLFFLQPNYAYPYDVKLFKTPHIDIEERRELIKNLYQRVSAGGESIDLSELFEEWGVNRRAFIDLCHYSPAFNKLLAKRVASYISLKDLKIPEVFFDEKKATGTLRT